MILTTVAVSALTALGTQAALKVGEYVLEELGIKERPEDKLIVVIDDRISQTVPAIVDGRIREVVPGMMEDAIRKSYRSAEFIDSIAEAVKQAGSSTGGTKKNASSN
jgi:hypothetical protein